VLKSHPYSRWEAHVVVIAAITSFLAKFWTLWIVYQMTNCKNLTHRRGETSIANEVYEPEFVLMQNFWNETLKNFIEQVSFFKVKI